MAMSRATTVAATGKLSPKALYLGDNGRCFCGSERCAGMTAFYTGRDLSGQRLHRLTPADDAAGRQMSAEFQGFRCETCKRGVS